MHSMRSPLRRPPEGQPPQSQRRGLARAFSLLPRPDARLVCAQSRYSSFQAPTGPPGASGMASRLSAGSLKPSKLVLVVSGDCGCQQSHDYRVEPGGLYGGCMVRLANHDHPWVFARFDSSTLSMALDVLMALLRKAWWDGWGRRAP